MMWIDLSRHYRSTGLRGLQPITKAPPRWCGRLDSVVFAHVWLRAALGRQHHGPVRTADMLDAPCVYRGAADA